MSGMSSGVESRRDVTSIKKKLEKAAEVFLKSQNFVRHEQILKVIIKKFGAVVKIRLSSDEYLKYWPTNDFKISKQALKTCAISACRFFLNIRSPLPSFQEMCILHLT